MIAQERIESAKAVSLVELIQSKGIAVEKRGHQYLAKCPFHEDHDPSLSIDTRANLFKCFGCGAAGDAIRFIELYEKKSFPKAVATLAAVPDAAPVPPKPRHRSTSDQRRAASCETVNPQELLNRVAEFYHAALLKEDAPRDYLARRGLTDPELYRRFKLGYACGGLLETLPQEGPLVAALKEIGILTDKGRDLFHGCVTVPLLDADGNTVGMYGRRIDDAGKVHHLYLPGPRRGLVNRQAAATAETVILTESIFDALSLIQNGFPNAIPLYGTNGLTEDHLALFHEHRPKRILLCLDNDEAGRKAAAGIAEKLKAQGFSAGIVELTKAKDINEFFQAGGSAGEISQLVARASSLGDAETGCTAEETELGLVVTCGDRQYRIRGIPFTSFDRFRVNIRATCGGRYHLDTLDLYQSKSRRYFAASLAKHLEIDQAAADRDLLRLIDEIEAYQARNAAKEKEPERKAPALTPEQEAEALGLLKDPKLIERILADLAALGHVGEETNKTLAYLIAVSRKLPKPLSGIVVSGSGAGKSGLVEAVQELVPPEDVEFFSRVTPQALYYMDRDALKRKLLIIEERTGGEGARHHNMQRLLRPVMVEIPYAPLLDFPADSLRTRRDHERFLSLIEAAAFLFQHQRERKEITTPDGEKAACILATPADYATAYELAKEILGFTLDDLKKHARDLLDLIREMVEKKAAAAGTPEEEISFTHREIREFTSWPDYQVKNYIRQLEDLEYLAIEQVKKGGQFEYKLQNPSERRPLKGLLAPEELEKRLFQQTSSVKTGTTGTNALSTTQTQKRRGSVRGG